MQSGSNVQRNLRSNSLVDENQAIIGNFHFILAKKKSLFVMIVNKFGSKQRQIIKQKNEKKKEKNLRMVKEEIIVRFVKFFH